MENEKLNPYENYEDKEIKRLQTIFLAKVLNASNKTIAEITGYAIATVKKYVYKFLGLLDKAKSLFTTGFEKLGEVAQRIRLTVKGLTSDNRIKWDVPPISNACGYVVEMYDKGKLLWLKVGMTERPIRERLKEHLSYWANKENENGEKVYKDMTIKVKALYPAISHEGAEITESALREVYKTAYPDSFIKNDRFKEISYTGIEKNNNRFKMFRQLVEASPIAEC